ncbi:MAG: biotin--[acetyl-CoA-carboxylase] ligase [Puniceicoccales bacterium]|jgi:BirA family biotin operon repressor/biotin-[acetyl-CoA-carboxylase] ligase|nr:biotin--[acetyl-CoA-carboxylase] ligase [Puniceicoccales bacterium]
MRVFFFDSVISTNDEVVKLLNCGLKPMFGVVANRQTGGRGCHGNQWMSEDVENIYFSTALPVEIFAANGISMFTQTFVLSFLEKLSTLIHLNVKWPNDIFFHGKKIGGALLETCFGGEAIKHAVFGVGINVASAPDLKNVPDGNYKAAALRDFLPSISYAFVLDKVVQSIADAVHLHEQGAFSEFIANNWKNFDMLHHRQVKVKFNGKIFNGEALGIDPSGCFILHIGEEGRMLFSSASAKIIL